MARAKTLYRCHECGATQPRWAGQCPACGGWNTLAEEAQPRQPRGGSGRQGFVDEGSLVRLGAVAAERTPRLSTGIVELDRVLGGGLVQGSVVLIGGDPGIGKSTLLLQAAAGLHPHAPVLYATGEESAAQIAARAERLGLGALDLPVLVQSEIEQIFAAAERTGARVLVADSIQTLYTQSIESAPGSVPQVRESAAQLVRHAKRTGASVFLVGHVTKEGALAGPRVLEHMVDTVLYFEGDSANRFRIIRAYKNRFGSVNELGVFAMTGSGLRPVANPSAIFLTRHPRPVSGSIVMAVLEGTRPLLLEVQALVEASPLGNPRRVCLGMDGARLPMLLAVLHRHAGVALFDQDVYVNLVGGVRVAEPATDLPLLLAALSSLRDRPLVEGLVAFGEIGLAGEVRPVRGGQERLAEAAKLGFSHAVVSRLNAPRTPIEGLEVLPIAHVDELRELLEQLLA